MREFFQNDTGGLAMGNLCLFLVTIGGLGLLAFDVILNGHELSGDKLLAFATIGTAYISRNAADAYKAKHAREAQ